MNSTNPPEGTIRAALRHRDFRMLLAGQAVSQFGDFLYNVALIALVYQRTGSALWAGVTSAARIVPMLIAGPFGGIIADRFNRRRVMVACDLTRLVLMLALALVAAWHLPIGLAPVLAALATAAAAPSMPSVAGVTPRLVPDADLPGANAARSVFTAAAVILGPGLGGVLLYAPPTLAFAINAATFGVSAACVLAVRAGGAFTVARSADGAARLPYRQVLIAALSAVGLSVAGVAVLHWAAALLAVAAVGGAAALLVEIMMDTGLQRMLPREVFGRAYGLAVPASIGVIGVGALLAPVLESALGLTGALLACAAAVLAYTAFLALASPRPAPAAPPASPAGDRDPESALVS